MPKEELKQKNIEIVSVNSSAISDPAAFKISDWKTVNVRNMRFGKITHKMILPFICTKEPERLQKKIDVIVEGEIRNGVPHGNCFLFFKHNGEFDDFKGVAKDP